MSVLEFINRWKDSELKERSAAQAHFIQLCGILSVEAPAEEDMTGERYCFEKGASKATGGDGWADVWKKGCFGWEYKGPKKDLNAAYKQLLNYSGSLESPPLLIVSDTSTIRIHTHFNNRIQETHTIKIEDLVDNTVRQKLRACFVNPSEFKPSMRRDALTEKMAKKFASIAEGIRAKGENPREVAHFVNRLVFCMFAEDVGVLPNKLFERAMKSAVADPASSKELLEGLFTAMHEGGRIGFEAVPWFNGGLFDDGKAFALSKEEAKTILKAARQNWSDIDPSILGTLFVRGLDPKKIDQLGAHYTSPKKILQVIEPTISTPLLRDWAKEKAQIKLEIEATLKTRKPRASKRWKSATERKKRFIEKLRNLRVLDPACGSGNFLYLTLKTLKDIEHRVNQEAEELGLASDFPTVGPECVLGVELNPYAAELARVSIWIGEMQWMLNHGFDVSRNPILRQLKNIRTGDAILNVAESSQNDLKSEWPDADYIVGNPPYIGSRRMGPELGKEYVSRLRKVYVDHELSDADLVTFWLAKAVDIFRSESRLQGVGYVVTNSIRDRGNRETLAPLLSEFAPTSVWTNEKWEVEGAAVTVAIINIARESDQPTILDDTEVRGIHPNLTPDVEGGYPDTSNAPRLKTNMSLSTQGVIPRAEIKKKPKEELGLPDATFNLTASEASEMLGLPENPNGRTNHDVIKRYVIADDITSVREPRFIVDFTGLSEDEAELYEAPFKHIQNVKLHRAQMNQPSALKTWWLYWNRREKLREAMSNKQRVLVIPRHSKHLIIHFEEPDIIPDSAVVVLPREDWISFGILQSRPHQLWVRLNGSTLETRPRYTPKQGFDTFPFPPGLGPNIDPKDYKNSFADNITMSSSKLFELRENWVEAPLKNGGKIRARRDLFNSNPPWFQRANDNLNDAVCRSYGWIDEHQNHESLSDAEIITSLFEENKRRSSKQRRD